MYQAVAYHKRTNKVHIWDDKNGHFTINYKPYAYRKATYGNMVALDGQTVQRVENPDREERGLYEADINPEMRTLIDTYSDSDEPSVGHRTLFIDIEDSRLCPSGFSKTTLLLLFTNPESFNA